jgi:uncharacterized UBP type Zn finger protein
MFEQQDSYELMFYLLDKITTVTAAYVRDSKNEGLRCSVELKKDLQFSLSQS